MKFIIMRTLLSVVFAQLLLMPLVSSRKSPVDPKVHLYKRYQQEYVDNSELDQAMNITISVKSKLLDNSTCTGAIELVNIKKNLTEMINISRCDAGNLTWHYINPFDKPKLCQPNTKLPCLEVKYVSKMNKKSSFQCVFAYNKKLMKVQGCFNKLVKIKGSKKHSVSKDKNSKGKG